MVAARRSDTSPVVRTTTALARALYELRVSERATAIGLSVLTYVDGTFWVAQRWTQDAASVAVSGIDTLVEMTASQPAPWDPPSALDPRGQGPRGLVDWEGHRTALVFSARTLLGVIDLEGARCSVSRRERSDALLARISTHLAGWIAAAPDPSARLVVGSRGLRLHTPGLPTPSRPLQSALTAWRAHAHSGARRLGLGLATVELEPLDGPAGPHLLVTLSRPTFYVVPSDLPLTTRQREIADLASRGFTVDEMAALTGCTPNTVKTHLKTVYRVLGVANRIELRELLDV